MTALADAPRRGEYQVTRRGGATALSRTLGRLALALLPVAALVVAVKLWGLVALGLVALAAVPVAFALLLALTVGK